MLVMVFVFLALFSRFRWRLKDVKKWSLPAPVKTCIYTKLLVQLFEKFGPRIERIEERSTPPREEHIIQRIIIV